MIGQWKEAIGSVNGYVDILKKNKTRGKVTVAFFDNLSYDIGRECPISRFEALTEGEYSPRGSTPLFDSFMRLAAQADEDKNEKTVIIVMTDGEENCSREATQAQVKQKVADITKRGWEVIFLGANFDVANEARNLGMASNKFLNSSTMNLGSTMKSFADRTRAYSGAAGVVDSHTGVAYTAGAAFDITEDDKEASA
jgi:hypothetical protein